MGDTGEGCPVPFLREHGTNFLISLVGSLDFFLNRVCGLIPNNISLDNELKTMKAHENTWYRIVLLQVGDCVFPNHEM